VVVLTTIYAFLAGAYQHLTDFSASMDWTRRLIDMGERLNAPFAVAIGYEYLSEDMCVLNWKEAIRFAEQDRVIGAKIGALNRVAWGGCSQAMAYYGLGELDKAIEVVQSALELAGSMGDIRLEIRARSLLALALTDKGEDEAALSAAQAQQRLDN
jgi:tetratricopeptide (TPR) repeat protein